MSSSFRTDDLRLSSTSGPPYVWPLCSIRFDSPSGPTGICPSGSQRIEWPGMGFRGITEGGLQNTGLWGNNGFGYMDI